jgi:hypothetical protein
VGASPAGSLHATLALSLELVLVLVLVLGVDSLSHLPLSPDEGKNQK